MHLLFTPNHVQLLNSCYPPTSALLTAGPEYSPNSQELSRLTYYASNHPGKLTKLGTELEKRLRTESRKAKAGNIRTRASLLITLSIFRSLATECRRDIALLSPSLVASVDVTIEAVPHDLEVVARAASVFTAWTTYTDGHLIGADSDMTRNYLSALRRFSHLSSSDVSDHEVRNRTRLVGLAALTGALNSEALYNNSVQFRAQVSTIMHSILVTLFQIEITTLDEQAAAVKEAPQSPYLAEFRTRPAIERRAASIHVHIDGDNGPSTADVSNATLRGLFSLLDHANGVQIGYIMQSSFDTLDQLQGWSSIDHCCWFAQKVAEWSQYQYRYAVPTWLVERLLQSQESTTSTSLSLHGALVAMITSVFNSPTPLVNLSTSDILSNLVTLLLRRAAVDPEDPILPRLVQCISSLGRHVYYSDQIQDLAAELISRLEVVEVQGVLAKGKPGFVYARTQAVRSILAGLLGLIQSANKHEERTEAEGSMKTVNFTSPDTTQKDMLGNSRSSRRARVPTDIWHNTLSLLCDSDYAVRADYSEALIFYLCKEMPKYGDSADTDGVKRTRPLAEGPFQQAVNMSALLHSGDHGVRFLNALHGYVYILATTPSLGLTASVSTSPSHSTLGEPLHLNLLPATPDHSDVELQEPNSPSQSQTTGRRSFSSPQGSRIQKTSVIQRLLEQTPSKVSHTTTASLSDYTHILEIIVAVHEQIPVRGLLTGIPMLLALAAAINIPDVEDPATLHRIDAVKEMLAKAWLAVGKVWDLPDIKRMAENVLSSMPWAAKLPILSQSDSNAYRPARNVVEFPSDRPISVSWEGFDTEAALLIVASSVSVQQATGLDKHGLLKRLSMKWTADSALMDQRSSGFESTLRGDGISPLLKISPALMHIENISMQSLARSARGVGVTDLREALEGRSSTSNTALARPPSISTLEHAPSSMGTELGNLRLTQTRSRSRNKKRSATSGSGEVRDVLNKLGIGKQNGSLLKASFPALQKSGQR
ncbi:hypothetical protein BDZ94DRAFT_1161875 [Collybia nuda]|uniref:Protein EFR3 n=1 Tax=Collybia nuda TaxID=64659 RepID=A0A9P6CJJ9_9AGAR|nr:hypothetical protein BDZ94DRAFT_1161875 [Collybia nuda]